jgi:hypothetical protein
MIIFETYLLSMKKEWILISCLVVLVFLSCKKDPAPERTTYFMDDEFVDHSIFKKGSWWIYEKDTMTPTDSVYVVKSELTTIAPDSVDYSWQRSEMQFGSSYNNDTVTSLGDLVKSTFTFYSKQKSSKAPASEALDFFSLKPVGYILEISPSLKMKYDTVRDALVDSIPFTNVKIYQNLVAPSNLKLPKELWYVKNVGVVRKELFNGEIWNLVKYNVVQ